MISLTTIALNEIDNVDEFVATVHEHVDEIVIVDTGSSDGTPDRLRELDCKVIETTIDDGLSAARNLGLEACTGQWILSLDFDERPVGTMMSWIKRFVARTTHAYSAAAFQRDNMLDGKLYSTEWHVRLFRRDAGQWRGTIHESVGHTGKCYKAPDGARILHDKSGARQALCNERYLPFYPKLCLGSGGSPMDPQEGWINYDLNPDAPMSILADVFEELPQGLPASYILASHILEHVSYHKAAKVLSMWIDKLAPGGTIEIRVPDLKELVWAYEAGKLHYLRFIQLMYGGQKDKRDYHFHAVDEGWLSGQFDWWGLTDIRRLHPTSEFELRMTARKP